MDKLSEHSDSGTDTSIQPPAPSEGPSTTRAMISFLFFGALGSILGGIVGGYGDNDNHKLARPFGIIFGGLFSGILAAYSSMRVSFREATGKSAPVELPTEANVAKPEPTIVAEPMLTKPQMQVDANSAEHHGEAAHKLAEMELA